MSTTPITDRIASELDLGIPKGARVVVAMSGGVDCSGSAALVLGASYDVFGMTRQLYVLGVAFENKG
ncbi:MAG: tRNA 2-thiouridine(34) synthase MnmA, partial [Pseudomonadota bacterium]